MNEPYVDQEQTVATLRQRIVCDLAALDDVELTQVAQFLSFLKFRRRINYQPKPASQEWEALYRQAADEDPELAVGGCGDVMLDAWCELPRPPTVAVIAAHPVDNQSTKLT